jgi:C4-dicarboxylate-binding protein DctP
VAAVSLVRVQAWAAALFWRGHYDGGPGRALQRHATPPEICKMKLISRRALIQATFFMAAACTAPATWAQNPIVIRFSHVVAPDTPKGKSALRFKELAEQRTGGRVKVEVYPNSLLYKDKDEMQALQQGSVQMLAPSLAKFSALGVPDFEVFGLPFLFKSEDAVRALTDGPLGAALFKKLEPQGIRGLAYWDNGFHLMSANKPLHSVADFKGLKMRIQNSQVLDAQMRALGANPQVIGFGAAYQALQSGVVDGTEGVASNFYTQKLFEVQKHLSISKHSRLAYAVIVNKKFWDALPTDLRATLEGALRDTTNYANAIAATENVQALDKIKASGRTTVYTLSPAESAQWKKALMPVHQQMQARVGQETLAAAYKATGFIPAK